MAHVKSNHVAIAAGLGCASLMMPSQAFAATLTTQQAFEQFSAAGGTTFLAGAAAGVAVTSVVAFFEMRAQEKAFAHAQHLACSKAVEVAREQLATQASHFASTNEYQPSSVASVFDSRFDESLDDAEVFSQDNAAEFDLPTNSSADESNFSDVPSEQPVVDEDISTVAAAEQSFVSHRSFFEERESRGVPVIARAEAAEGVDAWGNFTSDIDDNPAISCDPSVSRDLHEIAFTQLAQEAEKMYAAREQQANQDSSVNAEEDLVDMSAVSAPAVDEEVEVHDFSGKEDIWAAALAVLDELDDEEPVEAVQAADREQYLFGSAPAHAASAGVTSTLPQQSFVASPAMSGVMMAQPVMYVPAVPTYAVPVAYQTAAIPMDAMSQMSINNHVDELVKDEFSKCSSANVRRASLEIIDGESKPNARYMHRHA